MKLNKASLSITLSLLSCLAASCGNNGGSSSSCSHVDVNPKDFVCDKCGEKLPEPTELKIETQPKNVEVKLPQGCSFSVEVNNEKLVKSYMWQVYNGEIPEKDGEGPFGARGDAPKEQWLDLKDCSSGSTKTYIRTSVTNNHQDTNKYRCAITDIHDNVIYTNEAFLTFSNPDFDDPLVRVGGYVIPVGQSLDLSKTELGTGVISYVSRTELKLSNVRYHNELPISDNIESGTDGIMVYDETYDEGAFTVTLEGDNVIHNTYWDPSHNAGGIGLNFFFDNAEKADVTIKGDGNLAITGGSHAIYCSGVLKLQSNLILNTIGSHYGTGIFAHDIIIDGAKISGSVNGDVLHNKNYYMDKGTITIKNGSSIDVIVNPQHPSVGGGTAEGLSASGDLKIEDSNINIHMVASGDSFDIDHKLLGVKLLGSGEGSLTTIKGSTVNLSYRSDKKLDGLGSDAYGIMGKASVENSKLLISLDSQQTKGISGIAGSLLELKNVDLTLECRGKGTIYGIKNSGTTSFSSSNVKIVTQSYDDSYSLGFMYYEADNDDVNFDINTNGGIAIGVYLKSSIDIALYDPSYIPQHIDISKINVMNITDPTVNQYSIYYPLTGKYNVIETIYSLSDTTAPTESLVLHISK